MTTSGLARSVENKARWLHVKNWPRHRYEIYERNLDWYRFWLKGEEDLAPGKSQQYKYWRQLRENSAGAMSVPGKP